MKRVLLFVIGFLPLLSCFRPASGPAARTMEYASLLRIGDGRVVSISPYDGSEDTLLLDGPLEKVVCMSSSYVAFFDAIGCDSVICGVSGIGYVTSSELRSRHGRGDVADVGYDVAPDYEAILSMQPDVVLAYRLGAAESPFLSKLAALGVRVFPLYEFAELHPLGRAEYIKAFGLMTARQSLADSLFSAIAAEYNSLAVCPGDSLPALKVLMNVPYGDIWYVPGGEGYMATLVRDAGGELLGARAGRTESGAISMEEAFILSTRADCWLNTGWCNTRRALEAANPLFKDFKVPAIYNNTRRMTGGGGNDFWESGCVHPELVLRDLRSIFGAVASGAPAPDSLYYYLEVK